MPSSKELSQLARLIHINDETKSVGIITEYPDAKIGVGTENPLSKVDVVGDVNVSGVITATSFYGDGSNLTGLIVSSGINIEDDNNLVGSASTINFAENLTATFSNGTVTVNASSSSGIATYADVAGIATYATTSGISTVSEGLTGTPNITVGFITATDASFSGNVSIAGTLTYEDVTNVDSVGLVTARDGINIGNPASVVSTLDSSGNASFSGIVTASSFDGNLTGNADTATYSDTAGISTYASSAGVSTDVIGGTASVTSLDVSGIATIGSVEISSGIITATSGIVTYYGDGSKLSNVISGVGIQSSGTVIGYGLTTLNFIGAGNTFAVNGTTIDISISSGAGGTWATYNAGIATNKSVGVNTSTLDDPNLTGVGNSLQGLYISNGMIIVDNVLSGDHYIGTNFNGLMAGPVEITGTLTIDGNYVVV